MFKSLLIKNFQSHKRTRLRFHPGVNVILGSSRAGKTSIIRLIELIRTNKPAGVRYFSNFAGQRGVTVGKLKFRDGYEVAIKKTVRRTKDGTKKLVSQKYVLTLPNGKKYNYEGLKRGGVPDKVADAINMRDLNIQKQLDSQFILSSSGGKLAQLINEITGLGKVDKWQSTLDSHVRKARSDMRQLRAAKTKYKEQLEKYESLDSIEQSLSRLRELRDQLRTKTKDFHTIKTHSALVAKTVQSLDIMKREEKILKRYETKVEKLKKKLSNPRDLIDFIDTKAKLDQDETILRNMETEYKSLLKRTKVCPFCFSKIKSTPKIVYRDDT